MSINRARFFLGVHQVAGSGSLDIGGRSVNLNNVTT